jgi:hypothetical protein
MASGCYEELEQWIHTNDFGDYAGVRVEWPKSWAYTAAGAWTNAEVIGGRILASVTQGMAADAGFRTAVDMLDRLDPHRVFSTPFLDRLMPRSRDLTGDGQVNEANLLSKRGEGATPADLNADGVVNGADLAELPGRWTGQ